jgi:hypothetical protein
MCSNDIVRVYIVFICAAPPLPLRTHSQPYPIHIESCHKGGEALYAGGIIRINKQ